MLASPSAASGFVHQVELDAPVAIYTIGPSTTAAARALGLDGDGRSPRAELGRNFGGDAMDDRDERHDPGSHAPARACGARARCAISSPKRTVQRRAADHAALRAAGETRERADLVDARASRSRASRTSCKTIGKDLELGIRAVLLFGHPEHGGKTPDGRAAAAANGAVQRACERLKRSSATSSS